VHTGERRGTRCEQRGKQGRGSIHALYGLEATGCFPACAYYFDMDVLTIQHSEFQHNYTVTAPDLNRYGMMHGGRLLHLCDEAGYASARKHANGDCLTRAVHQAQFHHAVQAGERLAFRARVGLVGHSSLWVFIEVINARGDRCVMDAVFVYVAVDESRTVRQVSSIHADTDEEQQLQARLKSLRDTL